MKNKTIFIGYRLGSEVGANILASTTKVGLANLIGVGVRSVNKGLSDRRLVDGPDEWAWAVGEVELVKVGGDRGKVKSGNSGFLGMKGKDGLKKGIE